VPNFLLQPSDPHNNNRGHASDEGEEDEAAESLTVNGAQVRGLRIG
jgi:hypothetical protein